VVYLDCRDFVDRLDCQVLMVDCLDLVVECIPVLKGHMGNSDLVNRDNRDSQGYEVMV